MKNPVIRPYKVRTANGKGGRVFQHGTPVLSITKAQLAKHRCAKTDENLSFLNTRGILRDSIAKQGSFEGNVSGLRNQLSN